MEKNLINNNRDEEIEIDLLQLFKVLKKSWKLIVISTLSVAILASVYTFFFIPKKYASESTVFLTPKVNESGYVEQSSISSNSSLINTYISIIKGDSILSEVVEAIGNDLTVNYVKSTLSVTNDSNTQIIRIKSTTTDPQLSKDIVETIVNQFSSEMLQKLNVQNISVIDFAQVNETPVSPSKVKNAVLGAAVGFVLSCGYIFLTFIFDKRLRNKSEAENYLGIPVLAEIPWYED